MAPRDENRIGPGENPLMMMSLLVLSWVVLGTAKIIAQMRESPKNVAYTDLHRVCEAYFGPARQHGGSHAVFAVPAPGSPPINIQEGRGGKAKPYQVRQVLKAIDKQR
jgi:hypothetical protein